MVVSVFGEDAYWLEGAPHLLIAEGDGGVEGHRLSRLAANVLIWERQGVTYRIESNLDLADTLGDRQHDVRRPVGRDSTYHRL